MTFIFFLILAIFFYFDLALLRQSRPALFKAIFRISPLVWLIYGLMLAGILSSPARSQFLPAFFVLCVLPLYTLKRMRFKKALGASSPGLAPLDTKTSLALDAFGILLLWFLGVIAFKILLEVGCRFSAQGSSPLGEVILLSTFSFAFMLLLIFRVGGRYPDLRLSTILGLQRNRRSWNILVFIPSLAGFLLALISTAVLFSRASNPVTPLSEIVSQTTSSGVFLGFLAMAILMAPLFEELIFRGFFYYVVSQTRGVLFAVVMISLVFGGMHVDQYWGDWAAIGMIIILGFVMTTLRAWTGSSIPSIVMHYVYNGAMTVIPVVSLLVTNPSYLEYTLRYPQLDASAKERLLKESIQARPEYAPSYNDLAWLYAEEEKNLPEALRLIEQALAVSPDEYAFLDTKAEILYKMGRLEEAIAIEEGLMRRYPSDPYVDRQLEKFRQAVRPGQKE